MGIGKSTFVKGLTEDYDPDEEHLLPHTTTVTGYAYEKKDKVTLTIFDTPGLRDNINGTNDYSYLEDMVKNSQEPDLLIFAIRMDDSTFRREDMSAINNISAAFGWRVWRNAIIILTFANKVRKEGTKYDSRENKVYYNKVRGDFSQKITDILLSYKVQEDVANNIPVIPVGLVKQPFILSDERKVSWIHEFWEAVHARLKVSRQNEDDAADEPPTCPPCIQQECICDVPNVPEEPSWTIVVMISNFFSSLLGILLCRCCW